jgi:hypothetical protein
MVNLEIEGAIESIARLIGLSSTKFGFNWYGLAHTLSRWGNGVSERSLGARQQLLRDFYRAAQRQSEDEVERGMGAVTVVDMI